VPVVCRGLMVKGGDTVSILHVLVIVVVVVAILAWIALKGRGI